MLLMFSVCAPRALLRRPLAKPETYTALGSGSGLAAELGQDVGKTIRIGRGGYT